MSWGEKALAEAGADEFTIDDFSRAVGLWLSQDYRPAVVKAAVAKAIGTGALTGNRFLKYVQGYLVKEAAESKPLPAAPKVATRPERPYYRARTRPARNGDGHPADGGTTP